MAQTVIVSGGTGGLGSAVTRRLLDDGWRVVVPWVVESELSRLPESDALVTLEADLFDELSVAEVVSVAAGTVGTGEGRGQPRRRIRDGGAGARDADR